MRFAGLAAGTTFGVAKEAYIIPLRVFPCVGGTPISIIVDAMNWAYARMANSTHRAVINLSLIASDPGGPLDDGAINLVNAGAVVVAAAGNDHADACGFSPAGASGVIAAGATHINDGFAYFSNYGACVGILAPGTCVTVRLSSFASCCYYQ